MSPVVPTVFFFLFKLLRLLNLNTRCCRLLSLCSLWLNVLLLCPSYILLLPVFHLSRLIHLFFDWSECTFSHLSSPPTFPCLLDLCCFGLFFQRRPALTAILANAPRAARYSDNPIPILPKVSALLVLNLGIGVEHHKRRKTNIMSSVQMIPGFFEMYHMESEITL